MNEIRQLIHSNTQEYNTQECCTMDEIRQLIQTVIHKNAAQWTENYTIMGSQMEECALIARQM